MRPAAAFANYLYIIQGDQKVSVNLMITIQKVTSNVQCLPPVSRHLLTRRTVLEDRVQYSMVHIHGD
jgi:hypothetical protein